MTTIERNDTLDIVLLQIEVERFFSAEAELLDERRFHEWLELLHEDLRYWMPIARNVRHDQPASSSRGVPDVPGSGDRT